MVGGGGFRGAGGWKRIWGSGEAGREPSVAADVI